MSLGNSDKPVLGIIMPVWIQNIHMLDLTYKAVESFVCSVSAKVYVVTNRLHAVSPAGFQSVLTAKCKLPVMLMHEDGRERSVAGAWNHGFKQAIADGCQRLMIAANDTILAPGCIDKLLEFGKDFNKLDKEQTVAVWSALNTRDRQGIDITAVTEGSDFSCLMFTPQTFEQVGSFDERFKPAYFEDNDYAARVWLSGYDCKCIHAAQFYHYGSATTKLDKEAQHHVKHWWEANRKRLHAKWGHGPMERTDVLRIYHKHPWNDPGLPLSFWDRD